MSSAIPEDLLFYISAPHPCSYVEGRDAVTLFAEPERPLDQPTFNTLSAMGFRRSGGLVYTPRCPDCSACIPVRLPVEGFTPDRSQRRNWRDNQGIEARLIASQFSDEHIELYQRYVRTRHPDGSMNVEGRDAVERFFLCDWSETRFAEFRLDGRVVALSVVDLLDSGLSAVYTFYDPELERCGLGVYAVLWLIEEARRLRLPFLYLGYLIHESPKMAYKGRYRPQQHFIGGSWQPAPSP